MTDPADDLATAAERRDRLRERVGDRGERELRAVAEAHRSFERLLEGYEDRATGTGNFETYVEFQERVAEFVDGLDDDLPEREAFEAAADALEQRTLREKHFERAREAVAPARELAELAAELDDARADYRDARRAVEERIRAVDERIARAERLRELGSVDLDAPVERLREPVTAYDEVVREAFDAFRSTASAREVFALVAATDAYPLVEFRQPPTRLADYVATSDAGEEPIPTLLEYAGYSQSKLSHYVDEPAALKRHVATNRTYLEGLDGTPLTVGWPPPPAAELRWRCREYEAVVHRFADEAVVSQLRSVRALADREEYERLREAAVARDRLGPEERERLAAGEVDSELESLRAERAALTEALDAHPPLDG